MPHPIAFIKILRGVLGSAFNEVIEVNVLDSEDAANLALLTRPELGITFTKLHCWRLTQYEKCVFLDADTLVSKTYLQPYIIRVVLYPKVHAMSIYGLISRSSLSFVHFNNNNEQSR